jgi:hypothetical protein
MESRDDLFLSQQHPTSHRWAIVEDDGRVAYLYLTEPDTTKPIADCWLYNRIPTPPTFSSSRGEPPVVPLTHAAANATIPPPVSESVRILWSSDGESVAVFIDGELAGYIARGEKLGYSSRLRTSGPHGNIVDLNHFRQLFEPPPR